MAEFAPPEWPPRPGDVWRDGNGHPWAAIGNDDRGVRMHRCDGIHSITPADFLDAFGAAKIAHREAATDG